MKKMIILSVVAIALSVIILQPAKAAQVANIVDSEIVQDVNYEEITTKDLPQAVSESLTKEYAEYSIDSAFKGNDETYKVVISKEDTKYIMHFNEEGKVVKVEQPEDIDSSVEE